MKKIKYLLMILVICLLTGCVKFNVNMGIKKDKSMNFDITYAVNKTLLGDQELLEDKDKKELEAEGFTIKDYSDGDMKGYLLTKKITNIDDYSVATDTNYSLSGILEENADSPLFKVTKGLIKNTYKAKFNFDANDSGLTDNNDTDTPITDDTTSDNETTDTDTDTDTNLDLNGDLSSLTAGMDLSFNVTLPYAAKSNNATSTNDGLKQLTWKLDSSGMDDIEFEFELYNMTNIYIGIGVIALFIILVIVIVLGIKKGKGNQDKKDNQEKQVEVKPVEPSVKLEEKKDEVQEEIKEEKADVKINEPISPVMPSQDEVKEDVKPVNPMESINIVPVADVKTPDAPVAPVVALTPEASAATIAPEASSPAPTPVSATPIEPQIVVPPVVPSPVESKVETETNSEIKLPEPTPEPMGTPNVNQEEVNNSKIEQLEDL